MAEIDSNLLNTKSKEKLHNADDLDDYVRVARPGAWVLLLACALLIGGLVIWGLFGTVRVNVNGTAARIGDTVLCFLTEEDASHVGVGNDAHVDDAQLAVASISDIPLSSDEAAEILESDYLFSKLVGDEEWVYEVAFEGSEASDLKEGVPLTVSITVDQVTPFEMALGTEE